MLATTKVYGCIAHPIDHVKAPTLFTSIFNKKNISRKECLLLPLRTISKALND